MNLEELQIKIGIELKELNKQLKKASDDINKHIGPKATKKLMADNNKIVKDGFKDMEKTASASAKKMRKEVTKEFEAMSKDISKSLNKAFDLDMNKFNKNLTKSMNDAKTTVRSACNDIRRELNAALNIKANVRVNSSVSSSGSNVSSRTSDAAAIMQSSQYTGAMIAKAVNEMIKVNNANTARLEASIRRIESALSSEFGKLSSKLQASNEKARTTGSNKSTAATEHKVNVKADIETSVRVVESDLQSEVNKAINGLDVSDIKTSIVLDENIKDEVEKAINTVKAEDIKLKADLETNIKLNKDELQNEANQAVREVTTRDIEASIKVDKSNLQDEVEDAIHDVDVPELSAIIELDEHLQNDVNKAIREVNVPELNATLDLEHNLQDEVNDAIKGVVVPELNTTIEVKGNLQNDVNRITREVDVRDFEAVVKLSESSQIELQSEVTNLASKVTVPDFTASFEIDGSTLQSNVDDIVSKITVPDLAVPLRLDDYVFQFGVKDVSNITVPDLVTSFKLDGDSIRTLQANVNDAIKQIKVPKLSVELEAVKPKGKDNITESEKAQAKPQEDQISALPVLTDAQRMLNTVKDSLKGISLQEVLGKTSFDTSEWDILEAAIIKVDKASEDFESTLSELQWTLDPRVAEETQSSLQGWVRPLEESLSVVNKIGEELKSISSSSIDTTNLKTQVEILSESYKDLIDACKKGNVPAIAKMFHQDTPESSEDGRQYPPAPPNKHAGTSSKKGRPPKPTIDKNNSPRPPEDYLSITIDDEPDDIFDDFNKQVDSGIEIIKNKLSDLNRLYSSLFNRSFIGETFKYDLDLVNKELDKAFNKVKELKGEIEKLSGSIGLTSSTERLNSSIQDKPQASIVMGDEEEFSEFGDKVSAEIKEIEKQLNHLKMMYSSLFGRSVIGQTFQGDLGIVNESLGKTYNKVENLKESMNELDNSMGFRNKFPQDQDPNSGLPMVIDNTIDDQFDGIRKDIEDAYDKLQAFNKAIADLFDYLQMPIGAKFSKSIGDVEELKSAISNLLGMNKFGPGLEGYKKQVEHDSEEIIKDISKIYQALQTPFGGTSASFKEVAMLRGIIKEMTGIEPGADIIEEKELKEAQEEFKKVIDSLKYIDSEEVKIKFGSLSEFKKEIDEAEKSATKIKEDFKSSEGEIKFANDILTILADVKKRIKQLEDEEAEIQLKIDEENAKKAAEELFHFLQQQAGKTEGAIKDLFDSAKRAGQIPIDVKLQSGEDDARALQSGIEETLESYNKLKAALGMPIKDIIIGSDIQALKAAEERLFAIKEAYADLAKMDNNALREAFAGTGFSLDEAYAEAEELQNSIKNALDDPAATKDDKKFGKGLLKDIETVQKKIKELQDEDIKIQAEIEAQINAEAMELSFKKAFAQASLDAAKNNKPVDITPANFEEFKNAYLKAAMEAARGASQIPIEFQVIAKGAENLRGLFNLPEFKEHAEALRDILKGIDLGDDLKVNLDLDELLKKLKSIKSIDDIDIDLSDLRTDLIKLAEEADKMRSETEDEIEIKVIDDEVAKITELLKLLDKIQAQYNIKIDVDTPQGPILGSGNFTTRRRPGSGSFSTTPGGPTGSGGRGTSGIRPGSGNFTFGGYVDDDDIFGSSGSDPFDAHVVDHYRGIVIAKFKEIASKIKDIMGGISKSIKNGFKEGFKNVLKGTLSKMTSAFKSMWSKLAGIFKKGAKDCEKATNGLSLKLKDLLKTALSFGSIYGLINLGKQAIQQSGMLAQSEAKLASLMNKRMGATKETYQAIKALVSEQAKLGVVSEAAMTRGAEQLSMYVHSAKALETLIPAIANMTARRGGFNATENDAEEVATQLGEAIREGSITPLEQSGIYLSEAEIKKFQALRTEEERAAYLAQVVADNIGDINQNLAQTPHGQIAQLKNNFQALLGTLGTLLVNVIQPIVKWLNTIVVAANNALKALGHMLGFDMTGGGLTGIDMGTTAPGDSGIDDTKDSIDDTKDSLEEAEEAAEKFKGALMGFDEINILSNNSSKEDDPSDITPGEGGQLTPPSMETPEFEEGENIFTKFGEKMKAFLDEFLEPFKAAWDLLGDDLKAEWADLIESFKHFCDSLGSFLKSVWDNGGKEFVQHMAEIALACAKAAMEIGGEILDSLARLWDHLDPSKNMHTQRLLDVLNEVSEKIRDFILGLGDHFESLMANGGQDVLNALGDCFMDLGAAAVNGLGVAIDALDGLIDHLDPAVNENTRNMLQALADMFHAVGQAAWDFSELLRSALENGGQDMINAFGDMMMNLGETVARVITTMMESFSKFFDYIDPAKNDITKGMMKAWEEAFLAIGDMALGFAELFESIMANGGQDVFNKFGDAFNSLVGLVGTCVQEIADAMNGLFEHLDPKTNEFTQNMLKAWEEAFESISGMAKDIGEVLGSVMDNGGQEVVNAIGDLGVKIVGAFGKVTGTVADCVGDLFKHLDPAENDIAKGALESFEYFINSIGDFVDSLADALGTFMDNGGQEFVNNMGDIIALIGDLAFTIGGDILNAISTFMDSWLGHAVISTCATALELVSEVLKGLLEILEPLSPIISGVVTAIGGFVVAQKVVGFIQGIVTAFQAISGAGGVLALAKGAFTALWGVLAANPIAATVAAIVGIGVAIVALYNKCEGFREFIDGILKGFQDLFDELKEHFSNLLEDVRNIFGNVIDIIVGIFTGDGEKVGTAVRELIGNIIDLMMDMNKAFVEVGWALIKGLVQGIWECIKAIPSLLAGIGEFVVDFFKGLFGIHSPSTVFAELGVNLIEGLVKGITDSIKAVTDAFKKIGDAIFSATKDIAKTVSDKFKETKDAINEKLKETKEVVSEKWKEIKQTVSEKSKETYETAKENWKNIKEVVSERAKETYENVKGKFKEIYETVKDRASNTFEKVSDSWTKMKEDAGKKLEQIRTDAEKKYDQVKSSLVKKIGEVKTETISKWNEVKDSTLEGIEKVRSTAEEKYESIKETMSKKLDQIKSTTSSKWEEIKKDTAEKVEALRTTAEEKYNTLKESLLTKLEDTKSSMGSKWDSIKTEAVKKCGEMASEAAKAFSDIKKKFTDKLDEVKSTLGPKWDSLKTQAFNGAKNMVSQVKSGLSNIGSTISDAITGSKSKVNSALSEIGRVISGAKWSFPSVKLPKLPKIKIEWKELAGNSWFSAIKYPTLSWNARGGIIDGITPLGFANGAMQMGGESGKEMIVPLENTSFTTKLAKAMGQAVDNAMARNYNNNNNNNSTNENRDVVLQLDGREFARASINSINKLQRESGRTLLDI